MLFNARVHEPMYEHNDKKYMRVVVSESMTHTIQRIHASKTHLIKNTRVDNPLEGRILTLKVPFRYRRVMCEVIGRPVQSLVRNDVIDVDVEFMGVWNTGEYSGYTWKLKSIQSSP
jgi:hypothetical protein